MSDAEPHHPDLEAALSARLDGELDDAAWAAVCQRHGPQAAEQLAQLQRLREWSRSAPLPPLPPRLQPDIIAATSAAGANIPAQSWWSWVAAGAIAAVLAALVAPATVLFIQRYQVSDSPQQVALHEFDADSEPEQRRRSLATQQDDERPSDDSLTESGVHFAAPKAEGATEGLQAEEAADQREPGLAPRRQAGEATRDLEAPIVAAAPTAPPPASEPATRSRLSTTVHRAEADIESDAPTDSEHIDEETMAALEQAAQDFVARNPEAAQRQTPSPMPDAVLREALDASDRAEGREEADPSPDPQQRVRLLMTMGFTAEPDGNLPHIIINLANPGSIDLPMGGELLRVEGLNQHHEVIWTLHPDVPEDYLNAGATLNWVSPLDGEQLPPEEVRSMRLGYGSARTAPKTWPPPEVEAQNGEP